MTDLPVTLEDVRRAAKAISGAVARTPLVRAAALSEIAGCEVFLKLETLQATGAFKERGALNKLLSLRPDERRAGVVAMSAGNHAQGVAFHARRLGIPATIVMPAGTPFTKIDRTEALGAKVVLKGDGIAEAQRAAEALIGERGLVPVWPYDDPLVIAGQGTIALEILKDCEKQPLDALFVPIGGGGLISGIAVAAHALAPEIEIIGVQSALYPGMYRILQGIDPGLPIEGTTLAEGIAVKEPGQLTRRIVAELVGGVRLVTERQLEAAVELLLERQKLVVEGAGAAGVAALLAEPERFHGKRVVVTGGNIDARLLASLLMRGLVRGGRLVRLRCELPDLPGVLSRVSGIIGGLGANIVEVHHQRLFHDTSVKRAELDVVVETQNARHVDTVIDALVAAGYPTRLLSGNDDA
jgi:threonine dehydratase